MTDYPLKTLFWEATLRCNARCAFCGSRCGELPSEDLDGEIVKRAFADVAASFDPAKIMINVTGGEPLLRRDLFEVMGYADKLGFPWGMVTNGSLITDAVIARMKETHMRTISVSIDGVGAFHEKTRRLLGAFPKITAAVQKLAAADFLDSVQITTVVTKQNIGALEEMYTYFSGLGADSWRIALVDPVGRGAENTGLLLDAKDLARVFSFIDAHMFSNKLTITTSCSHYLGEKDALYRAAPFSCSAGKTVASILANGDIFVCPNVARLPELIQGTILRDSLPEVWENGFAWFRNPDSRRAGECAGCALFDKCRGDSLHTWNFAENRPNFCIKNYFPDAAEFKKDFTLPPALKAALKPICKTLRGFKISYGSTSAKKVVFLPSASAELNSFFHWGEVHPANICELMAGLAGHRFGETAFIEAVVPVFLEERGKKEAFFSKAGHAKMLDELTIMNDCKGQSDPEYNVFSGPFSLLGYVHSHPGELNPCMSVPDLELHERLKENSPDFVLSGIINPQKKELRIYWDSVYMPVDVVLLMDEKRVCDWE
ncbi:MAG TPA: radical SAM protein [Methanocorpusculum sp.]|nr:radical SAM protein [Methanocorpusculum sp.]